MALRKQQQISYPSLGVISSGIRTCDRLRRFQSHPILSIPFPRKENADYNCWQERGFLDRFAASSERKLELDKRILTHNLSQFRPSTTCSGHITLASVATVSCTSCDRVCLQQGLRLARTVTLRCPVFSPPFNCVSRSKAFRADAIH